MSPCPTPRPLSVQYLSCHLGSLVWLMILLLHVALSNSSPALSPVLVMSSRVTGMADDPPTPCRPVQLIARSQSNTLSCHLGSLVWLMILLLHVALSNSSPALSPVLVMSSRVTGMADDPPTPCRPVQLLARSQASTCHVI